MQILLAMSLLMGCAWKAPPTAPTLEQKIGQMLMVGFRGTEVDRQHFIIRDIRQYNLGGVILFDYDVIQRQRKRNISSPAQIKSLITSLQQASTTPLLIAIDQEGGNVARLKERDGFPATLSHSALGRSDNLKNHRKRGRRGLPQPWPISASISTWRRWSISAQTPTIRSSQGANAASRTTRKKWPPTL